MGKRREVVDVHGRTHVLEPDGSGVGRDFYVSVMDGGRVGYLLGPFKTHSESQANVERGRKLAEAANDRAIWYGYGTCSAPHGTPIKTVFGG